MNINSPKPETLGVGYHLPLNDPVFFLLSFSGSALLLTSGESIHLLSHKNTIFINVNCVGNFEKPYNSKKVKKLETPRNRKAAILQALQESEGSMNMENLCQRAHDLRPQREGPQGYRKTIVYLGNLEGIWSVTGTKGQEKVTLEQFLSDQQEKETPSTTTKEPEIIPEVPKTQPLPEPVTAQNGIVIIEPEVEDFTYDISRIPAFIDYYDCFPTMDAHFAEGENLFFEGPPGQGKTLGSIYWSVKNGFPVVVLGCNSRVREHHLIGMSGMRGNQTTFTLGALVQAIVLANKAGNATLVIDELPALDERTHILLHTLDWRREVYVPNLKKMYRLRDGANLMIVATGNPVDSYAGLTELNPALSERFPTQKIGYPDPDTELTILDLEDADGELSDEFKKQLIRAANQTRAWVQNNGYGYPISTRALHKFMRLYRAYRKVKNEHGEKVYTPVRAREKAIRNVFLNKMNDREQLEWFKNDVIDPTFHTRLGLDENPVQAQEEN
jgi:MoxR-like ATPase